MATIERLLTMGLAHGADPRRMLLPASGTNPAMRLDWTDIHKTMACCKPEQRAILYLKPNPAMVSGQDLAALTNTLWRGLIRFEARRNTKDPAPDTRQAAMVRTALAEYQDNRVCRTCYRNTGKQGHIQTHVEGKGVIDVPCPRCNGAGWVRWSDNRRYRSIGGDRNAYTQRIAPGYEHLMNACTTLYREAQERFMEVLYGETPEVQQRRA